MPIFSPDTLEFISRGPDQTHRVGARLGTLLQEGDVVALEGNLGVGKTLFVQGVGAGWGATSHLLSPTFILMRCHKRHQDDYLLYHIDLYRLKSAQDVTVLGLEEILGEDGSVCLIEWADRAPSIFPEDHLWISLRWLDDYRRSLVFCASGKRHKTLLENLRKEIVGR